VKGALEGFAGAGHSTGRAARGRRRVAATPRGESRAAIREWARAQGYAVGDRGRIPGELQAAYASAHSQGRGRR
jgi:hypothetical protein